jgi:hypothetical protein
VQRLKHLELSHWLLAAALLIGLQAVTLHALGRVLYCTCGYIKFWEGEVNSSGNSQHLTDWYSFSHIIHGFIFYFLTWLVGRRWPLGVRFLVALGVEVSWEIIENTNAVIEHYRAATISLDYYGDSIVNSLSDTLMAAFGFFLARALPVPATVALALAMEVIVGAIIRDNLTLNILMLLYPVPAIKAWQLGG